MIGVVLWSDPPTGRAVIWCEDHSGLAYVTGQDEDCLSDDIGVADIVSFKMREHNAVRRVSDIRKLDQSWGHTLLASLKSNAMARDLRSAHGDNVVPLRPRFGSFGAAVPG